MTTSLMRIPEASEAIASGRFLAIAADEQVLGRLPRGNWIGGTIPYFIADTGGTESRDLAMVTVLAEADVQARILAYDAETIPSIAKDAPDNGFTILILPGLSEIHSQFAAGAPNYDEMYLKPLAGWISGVHLSDLGLRTPKTLDGRSGLLSDRQGLAIHVPLPAVKLATVGILNIFRQGDGDRILFPEAGFSAAVCEIDGKPVRFAHYVRERGLDLTLPLVADYHGAQINVSFKEVDEREDRVTFFAPVFPGVEYRQAAPVPDYAATFGALASSQEIQPLFTCNCILNYLHGKLEGKRIGTMAGPVTFGEIGYQLLNQTLVYLRVLDA